MLLFQGSQREAALPAKRGAAAAELVSAVRSQAPVPDLMHCR